MDLAADRRAANTRASSCCTCIARVGMWLVQNAVLACCEQQIRPDHMAGRNMPMPHLLLDADDVAVQPRQHHLLLAKAYTQHLRDTTSPERHTTEMVKRLVPVGLNSQQAAGWPTCDPTLTGALKSIEPLYVLCLCTSTTVKARSTRVCSPQQAGGPLCTQEAQNPAQT